MTEIVRKSWQHLLRESPASIWTEFSVPSDKSTAISHIDKSPEYNGHFYDEKGGKIDGSRKAKENSNTPIQMQKNLI